MSGGLGSKSSDAAGAISWTWTLDTSSPPGSYSLAAAPTTASVSCNCRALVSRIGVSVPYN